MHRHHSPALLLLTLAFGVSGLPVAQEPSQAIPSETAGPPSSSEADAGRLRLTTLWEGALLDSANGQDFAETDGYRRLMLFVSAEDPVRLAEGAVPFDRSAALAEPDALRGSRVRVRGLLAELWANRLVRPLNGHEDVWRGLVTDTDGSGGVLFDILDWPGPLETGRDLVDVEGVFYRTVRFQNMRNEVVEAPYVVARGVSVVDTRALKRGSPVAGLPLVLILAALAYFGFRSFSMIRRRRLSTAALADPSAVFREKLKPAAPSRPANKSGPPPSSPAEPQ